MLHPQRIILKMGTDTNLTLTTAETITKQNDKSGQGEQKQRVNQYCLSITVNLLKRLFIGIHGHDPGALRNSCRFAFTFKNTRTKDEDGTSLVLLALPLSRANDLGRIINRIYMSAKERVLKELFLVV